MSELPRFLLDHLPTASATTSRPHITVTWAQSLDSKIAGPDGQRVILSGPESMLMTHWMRSMHDAILIGVNTLILDNPRLQANLLPPSLSLPPPQPLILDPKLRFPITSRILNEWNTKPDQRGKTIRQPWIICGDDVSPGRVKEVEDAGARVILVKLDEKGHIPPSSLPSILTSLGLKSVMIEGGSKVLSTFLHCPTRGDGSRLVDSVVVTVAPMFIGEGIGGEDIGLPVLKTVHTEKMGKDAVMVCEVE
uniref:2,5-diamino-6-ribosylamino-4(3H)-pyrimidinone 5'-phosphate reductase n=1 Tax=Kwoniella bestiolae CBS 10118 TaxID=1296100 RepID=A0A1B9GGG9_9TREE|nr:2,5-diamino-6-(ribosylamino)-4(3H)-pyrimidinone 5'-phosphate reductase [Kwoniella bestiolae CBS 10118]OCF30068.1 2,5-diamino-6-(ribosylamino)-4(3H)-pyrimidinone 5'-phosphate reductase [Kwoniella bestiolae CBS 10118]